MNCHENHHENHQLYLVNCYITMENHHSSWVNHHFSWVNHHFSWVMADFFPNGRFLRPVEIVIFSTVRLLDLAESMGFREASPDEGEEKIRGFFRREQMGKQMGKQMGVSIVMEVPP